MGHFCVEDFLPLDEKAKDTEEKAEDTEEKAEDTDEKKNTK